MKPNSVRIWHKSFGRFLNREEWFLDLMGNVCYLDLQEGLITAPDQDLFVIQRWTSLFDKTGMSIYDGDIIVISKKKHVIYWENKQSGAFTGWGVCELRYFKNLNKYGYTYGKAFTPAKSRRCEVIGNLLQGEIFIK